MWYWFWRLVLTMGLLFSVVTPVVGQWKTRDVVLATTAVTFAVLDYSTTMDAVRRCQPYGIEQWCFHGHERCVEGNPLIGCFPSPMKLRAISAISIAAEVGVGAVLHGWKRTAWFAGWTVISASLVRHNVNAGFHLTVKF